MPGPYNYSLNLPNPIEAVFAGLQFKQQIDQQRAADELKQRRARVYAGLGPGAGYQDYMRAIQQLPEDRDGLLKSLESMDEAKKRAMFDAGGRAFALLEPVDGAIDPTQAVDRLEEYATAFEDNGDVSSARQLRDAAKAIEVNPQAGRNILGTMLAVADGDRFEKLAGADRTAFQKDYNFIKDTFGEDAAAEFAQYGRGGIVSIPLGDGQTYVGPASMAPGAARWQQAEGVGEAAAGKILQGAAESKTITQDEAKIIRQSLGPKGQAAFEKWMGENSIRIIVRSGTAPDGRRVVEYADGAVEYAEKGRGSGDASDTFPGAVMGYPVVTNSDRSQWGSRADGSDKGSGFLGVLKRPDGGVSSEISVGVEINGREVEIPLMVPGLTKPELDYLMKSPVSSAAFLNNLPQSIMDKAVAHAKRRIAAGLSPFAMPDESPGYGAN